MTKAAKNESVACTMNPVASGATMPPQLATKWTKPETPPKPAGENQCQEKCVPCRPAEWKSAATPTTISTATSIHDMIHCALVVIVTPAATTSSSTSG